MNYLDIFKSSEKGWLFPVREAQQRSPSLDFLGELSACKAQANSYYRTIGISLHSRVKGASTHAPSLVD
jgi:hypothetical protein